MDPEYISLLINSYRLGLTQGILRSFGHIDEDRQGYIEHEVSKFRAMLCDDRICPTCHKVFPSRYMVTYAAQEICLNCDHIRGEDNNGVPSEDEGA